MRNKEEIQIKINKVRQKMKIEKIDAYLVLSSDFHNSEYVGKYFKCREYISGFTGSAGNVLITKEEAGLWTDGRYFLQAEDELAGSNIKLFKMNQEDTPQIEEYIVEKLPEYACLALDGRTISVSGYRNLKKVLDKKYISIRLDCDLIGEIWENRPLMSCESAWELDVCYAGKTRKNKLMELQKKLYELGADCTVISSLDDIAWVLNVRGKDIACTPVVLGYLIIGKKDVIWFVQQKAIGKSLRESLQLDGVILCEYGEIFKFLSDDIQYQKIYIDPNRTNMIIYQTAYYHMQSQKGEIIEGENITLLPKAIKNITEIENIRKAHIKDAVACIKFIYWLKNQFIKTSEQENNFNESINLLEEKKDNIVIKYSNKNKEDIITEITIAKKLEEFRQLQDNYLGISFNTIVGYAQHGAIIHYNATSKTDIPLQAKGLVLIDSGGHYLEGTTDITRTIALGELSVKEKHYYTLVLKGSIKLAAAKFKYGCTGIHLDYLARESMWEEGIDYNHGTGHGVGYLLSVHESPNCIRNQISESKEECVKLEAGMITSNEPGIYIEGAFGIRLENLILCKETGKNEYGRFMEFETLTLVPFERDAILVEELSERERIWLNLYHRKVFDVIGPFLDKDERNWLEEVTAEIK